MIGAILKDLRAEKHVTQIQLASKLNVKQSTISSWEIERTSPTLEQLGELANIFGVSADYLIGRTDDLEISGELSPLYKRKLRMANAHFTLNESYEAMQEYCKENEMDKERLVSFLDKMNETDFTELCNLITIVIEGKR